MINEKVTNESGVLYLKDEQLEFKSAEMLDEKVKINFLLGGEEGGGRRGRREGGGLELGLGL